MIPEEYESVVEKQIFSLHETQVSSRQTISNNVWTAINVINTSDDLSSHYVSMERLAVAMLTVMWVVANAH